ncbi:hypothetical protein [Paraburkholderia unamae]|uniref:Uncharacterized protein n=1 Tax=Paraburkholderia unamae TaxID=219649 RepID=A0ABX5KTH6_9BURK|nr:hypothetical protein [Paraburkholderia unamae]PVX86424.1 hypothetical protein C7402_102260 [Paraburkholderia unamae]RAR68031.1 hypothetical protein C7401_101270 [Paraburkholderia unamae]CAG9250241.1 conserved exported hypothetical protein [Paraburkholderia unamae]
MTKRQISVVFTFPATSLWAAIAALAALLVPLLAHAQSSTRDEQFDCKSNPHTFISSLIDEKSIDPQPSRVEANSVNAFRPVHGNRLSAFGFPIYVVLGYERDDTLFRRGAGKEIASPLYGVVVSAPAETVRSRVREANSDATVQSVVPLLLTAIVCGG